MSYSVNFRKPTRVDAIAQIRSLLHGADSQRFVRSAVVEAIEALPEPSADRCVQVIAHGNRNDDENTGNVNIMVSIVSK